jgi:hypothetical protein
MGNGLQDEKMGGTGQSPKNSAAMCHVPAMPCQSAAKGLKWMPGAGDRQWRA